MTSLYVTKPRVELDGTPLPPEIDGLIEQIVVDDSRILPDMFRVQFRDPQQVVFDTSGVKIGSKVKIFAGQVGQDAAVLLFSGEVTALEAEIDNQTGTHTIVRGYDSSHRLQRGRKTRTFVQVDEDEIIRRVVQGAGLATGTIEIPATTRHDLVSQMNQSDLEFLRGRAREIGYDLTFDDGKVEARAPIDAATAPPTGTLQTQTPFALVFGNNLESFLPRITSAEQVEQVEVRGWDPDQQQAVSATAPAKTASVSLGAGAPTPETTAAQFGSGSQFAVVDRPLRTVDEAQHVADAAAEQLASAFAEAEGIAEGDPRLQAGAAVSVAGVGHPFEGRYTISSARHVIGVNGYKTHFTVSGRQERSLLGLASDGATGGDASAGGAPIYGVVIAVVTNNGDPDDKGRVKLKFPWLDDQYESDWARVVGPGAGKERGIAFLPEVNDEVLVAFEQGDVRSPFVIGGLWSGQLTLPPDAPPSGGSVDHRVLQSRDGHKITLDDAGDEGITIVTGDGANSVKVLKDGKIEITSNNEVTIKGQTISVQGTSISIQADGTLELKGATINVTGSGPTAIKGSPLALN